MTSGQVLDMQDQMLTPDSIADGLSEILNALGLKPCMKSFQIVALDLSRIASKKPEWTKKYIHSVYHRKIEASPILKRAIMIMLQKIDGVPSGVAGAQLVKVFASIEVTEGVLIPANAKIIKCATPGCPIFFVRVHPTQKYHDKSCKSTT